MEVSFRSFLASPECSGPPVAAGHTAVLDVHHVAAVISVCGPMNQPVPIHIELSAAVISSAYARHG
jgi:hypothetical protein